MIVTRKDVEQLAIEAINDAYPGQAHQMQSLIKSITNKFFHHVYNSEMTDEDMEYILDKGTLAKFSGIVAHIYVWDERRITKLKIAPTSNWRFRNADTFVTRRLISMFGEFDNNIEEDKLDILEVQ